MSDPQYHINVFWSGDDGCWIVTVPDLKYCSANGDTAAGAAAQFQITIEGWLETTREPGVVIPRLQYRPATA